ncbi:MAG: pentapeptide repeat-containing protein [Nanoarchaeota archaeon]
MAEDGLVEGSIYNQIKAIEGWALNAYQESVKKVPNVDAILENLRKINLQARKLEWRGTGLKNLPKGEAAEDLKKKITQLRAAVVTLRDIKKDKELGNASKRTIRMLSSLATETIKLVEQFAKGLPDLHKFRRDNFEDFLRGEDEYASYALDVRRKLWKDFKSSEDLHQLPPKYDLNINLSNADLHGFDFGKMILLGVNFSGANLTGASFSYSSLRDVNFSRANIEGANFTGSQIYADTNFTGVKAHKADFKTAWFMGGKIELSLGDFSEADFSEVDCSIINNPIGDLTISGSNFKNANFKNAKINILNCSKSPSFENANVKRAKFFVSFPSSIPLLDAQLRKAKNYSPDQLKIKQS